MIPDGLEEIESEIVAKGYIYTVRRRVENDRKWDTSKRSHLLFGPEDSESAVLFVRAKNMYTVCDGRGCRERDRNESLYAIRQRAGGERDTRERIYLLFRSEDTEN